MKKILYSVFMLATMVLAACSSEDTTEPDVKRGMVLKANVEDTDTRATLTDNEGKWKFAFATNDEVKVGNDQVTDYYTFKNNGTVFDSKAPMPSRLQRLPIGVPSSPARRSAWKISRATSLMLPTSTHWQARLRRLQPALMA